MELYSDFDGTIFSHEKFINDYFKAIKQIYNLPFNKIRSVYEVSKNVSGYYHWKDHLRMLDIDDNNFINKLDTAIINFENYIYPDAISFLNYLKAHSIKLDLISLGEQKFQNWKVRKSLFNYDYSLITTQKKKQSLLSHLKKDSIYIDNRSIHFSKNLVCKQIRIFRQDDKYSTIDKTPNYVTQISDLKEVISMIEKTTFNDKDTL